MKFTDDCLIGIEEIDNEHRRLFKMIEEAVELSEATDNVASISKNLIAGLKDYAMTHFMHEEAYMESINDPELIIQKKEHKEFTEKVNSFIMDTSSPENMKKSLNELLNYLVRWLYCHILGSDVMIGKMSADKNSKFAFTEKYYTGIEMIDDEHRHLFELIQEINDLIHNDFLHDKYDETVRMLSSLKNYTEFHFHDEEELMERINYPEIKAQKQAHAIFVERLVDIDLSELDDMDNNQQEYLFSLIQFLTDWLVNHILAADKKIGAYIRENNITI